MKYANGNAIIASVIVTARRDRDRPHRDACGRSAACQSVRKLSSVQWWIELRRERVDGPERRDEQRDERRDVDDEEGDDRRREQRERLQPRTAPERAAEAAARSVPVRGSSP